VHTIYFDLKTCREGPLGRSRRIWEYTIKLDLKEIKWEVVDWIHLTQNRNHWRDLVKVVMNLWVP